MERITIGSIRQASANEPASPEYPKCSTQIVKMNRPITIDGTPVITSAMKEMSLREPALAAVLVDVDRAEHAKRYGDERGEAGDHPACR